MEIILAKIDKSEIQPTRKGNLKAVTKLSDEFECEKHILGNYNIPEVKDYYEKNDCCPHIYTMITPKGSKCENRVFTEPAIFISGTKKYAQAFFKKYVEEYLNKNKELKEKAFNSGLLNEDEYNFDFDEVIKPEKIHVHFGGDMYFVNMGHSVEYYSSTDNNLMLEDIKRIKKDLEMFEEITESLTATITNYLPNKNTFLQDTDECLASADKKDYYYGEHCYDVLDEYYD